MFNIFHRTLKAVMHKSPSVTAITSAANFYR